MFSPLEELITERVHALPEGLRQHIHRVQDLALELATRHRIDQEKTGLAALAHDVARAMKGEQLLLKARDLEIATDPVDLRVPLLLHGPVGAELLRCNDGLKDRDVYEAVYWHSTASRGLGPVAKVVFLADKLDPQKARRYPFQAELKDTAMASLDEAMLLFLDRELVSLVQHGYPVHPRCVEARNELVMNLP